LVMSAAPPHKAGAASGTSETSFEFGAALGVAVLGSILTAIYRTRMTEVKLPDLSGGALDVASHTLGGALAVAEGLQSATGGALIDAAREAFTQSMQATAFVSALLSVAAALVCTHFMQRVSVSAPSASHPDAG